MTSREHSERKGGKVIIVNTYSLGLYEKAMPDDMSIMDKLKCTKQAGLDFMEISIDESEEKQRRLISDSFIREVQNAVAETGVPIKTMCLSGHRKYPLGSKNPSDIEKSLFIMQKAIDFACAAGIRIIQLAGYDVYYESGDEVTRAGFLSNLQKCVEMASRTGVILAFETMETDFMNTVAKAMRYVRLIDSPYLQVYPDIGNIRNATEDYAGDIGCGEGHIVAAHLKETKEGVFRDLEYGRGRVDFKGCVQKLRSLGVGIFTCEFWYDKKTDPLVYIQRNINYLKGTAEL